MKLKNLEHVLVVARDLDETRDFYTGVLGLAVGPRPDFSFPGYWLYLGDTPCVHLSTRDRQPAAGGAIDHVAFNGEDFDGTCRHFDELGIAYTHRQVPGRPLQQIFLTDPNDVKIEINFAM